MTNVNVTVTKDRYTVDRVYQWDKDQVLKIYGLSLASIPGIHFANGVMERAIVRQATMDSAGVITADIPNSLLQSASKITAYVCAFEGDTFETLYAIEIPVEGRKRPSDYTLEVTDEEVYSFNALENKINNALVAMQGETRTATQLARESVALTSSLKNSITAATAAANAAATGDIDCGTFEEGGNS